MLFRSRGLFPFPPPPDCGWQEWCYIHKIDPGHRRWCHDIAEFWWWLSPTDNHCLSTGVKMTDDNAVLFCWLSGNKFKKHSTTELVHQHLVQTSETILSMHARRQKITYNKLKIVMQDGFDVFRRAAANTSKYQCGGCLEQCTAGLCFRLCARCKQVRYCSEDCQEKHWKEYHRKVCKLDSA